MTPRGIVLGVYCSPGNSCEQIVQRCRPLSCYLKVHAQSRRVPLGCPTFTDTRLSVLQLQSNSVWSIMHQRATCCLASKNPPFLTHQCSQCTAKSILRSLVKSWRHDTQSWENLSKRNVNQKKKLSFKYFVKCSEFQSYCPKYHVSRQKNLKESLWLNWSKSIYVSLNCYQEWFQNFKFLSLFQPNSY